MADFDRVRRLQGELSKLDSGGEIDLTPRRMTVDPAVVQALAELIKDHIWNLPVDEEAEVRMWPTATEASARAVKAEITTDDLIPAVRAAAYRLAAREAAGRG